MRLPVLQSGLTLLELLVTLVIVSLGLLGVGALQANALKNNHDAQMYSKAAYLSNDIIERMRVNPTAVRAGNYALYMGASVSGAGGGSVKNCAESFCTSAEIATYDLFQWLEARVKKDLPEGAAAIASGAWNPAIPAGKTTQPPVIADITIRWRGHVGGNCDSSGSTNGGSTDYKCYTLTVSL